MEFEVCRGAYLVAFVAVVVVLRDSRRMHILFFPFLSFLFFWEKAKDVLDVMH